MEIIKDVLFLVEIAVKTDRHVHEERDPPLNNFPPDIYINGNTLAPAGVFFYNDLIESSDQNER